MSEDLANNKIYPDFVPERCRTCPAMEDFVENWQRANTFSDLLLEGAMNYDPETLGEQLPAELVSTIGMLQDQSLDPVLPDDRTDAAKIVLGANDQAYQMVMEEVGVMEGIMREKLAICEGQGPLKVRVRPKTGAVLVRLCLADLGEAHFGHTHETLVTLEREKEQE